MINAIGTIAIYVDNQEASQKFWTEKIGFVTIREDQMSPHQFWIEVAPSKNSATRLLIYSKDMMLEHDESKVCHPSLVFECKEIESFYKKLKDQGIEVGDLRKMNMGAFFELKDNEGNSYLVREI